MWISHILTVGMTRQQTFPAIKPKSGESAERTHTLFWSIAAFVLVGMGEKIKNKICNLQN